MKTLILAFCGMFAFWAFFCYVLSDLPAENVERAIIDTSGSYVVFYQDGSEDNLPPELHRSAELFDCSTTDSSHIINMVFEKPSEGVADTVNLWDLFAIKVRLDSLEAKLDRAHIIIDEEKAVFGTWEYADILKISFDPE